jgi:Family of unknown function (DUF6169)
MYKFSITDGEPIRYFFKTTDRVVYEVLFKATPYLFDNLPAVNEFVYELIIGKLESPVAKVASDPAIPETIAAICADFFGQQQQRIVLFICDSSDGRQHTRARKFRDWFDRFNDTNYIKLDAKIAESTGSFIFLSLIFSLHHVHLHDIIGGFEQLTSPSDPSK